MRNFNPGKFKKMECPYCNQGMQKHDEYGRFNIRFHGDFIKSGDIYKCENEQCESQCHNGHFYTRGNSDELNEGYPC
jgi:hypothetical protein